MMKGFSFSGLNCFSSEFSGMILKIFKNNNNIVYLSDLMTQSMWTIKNIFFLYTHTQTLLLLLLY